MENPYVLSQNYGFGSTYVTEDLQKSQYIQIYKLQPFILLYVIGRQILYAALNNLELDIACHVNAQYSGSVCNKILDSSEETETENRNVQIIITTMYSWQVPIHTILPFLWMLFFGSLSGIYRLRKFFLMLPVFGEIVGVVGCRLTVQFMDSHQLNVELVGFFRYIVPSLFGGIWMFTNAVDAQLTGFLPSNRRGVIIVISKSFFLLASAICHAIGGKLFRAVGYKVMMAVSLICLTAAFLYGLLVITNMYKTYVSVNSTLMKVGNHTLLHVISVIFRKRRGNKYTAIYLLLITSFFTAAGSCDSHILFLYSQLHFHWTVVEFSYFQAVYTTCNLLGTITTYFIIVSNKSIKITTFICITSTLIIRAIPNILLGFYWSQKYFYLASATIMVQSIYSTRVIMVSTIVAVLDDIRKLLTLIELTGLLAKILITPLCTCLLYNFTLITYPGAVYLLSGSFNTVAVITSMLFTYAYYWSFYQEDDDEFPDLSFDESDYI